MVPFVVPHHHPTQVFRSILRHLFWLIHGSKKKSGALTYRKSIADIAFSGTVYFCYLDIHWARKVLLWEVLPCGSQVFTVTTPMGRGKNQCEIMNPSTFIMKLKNRHAQNRTTGAYHYLSSSNISFYQDVKYRHRYSPASGNRLDKKKIRLHMKTNQDMCIEYLHPLWSFSSLPTLLDRQNRCLSRNK